MIQVANVASNGKKENSIWCSVSSLSMTLENGEFEEKEEEDWIPTREEKERYVFYLYGKGKSYREIAKVVHVSFSDISRIIRAKQGYPEPKKDESQLRSETRALKLFEDNREPIEVAIELNIPTEEALGYYQSYQELKSSTLTNYYEQVKNEVGQIENAKQNVNLQLNQLRTQATEQNKALQYFMHQVEEKKNELFILNYYANNLQVFLSNVRRQKLGY